MKRILVKSITQSYPVFIENNTILLLPKLVSEYSLPKRIFVILDRNVDLFFGSQIKRVIKSFADKLHFSVVTASEKNKSLEAAAKIFSTLQREKFGRDTLLIAIGGGTIGDLAGFVASTYMRGITLIHIPTTLLSMVDSSIGGKTGVNFKEAKNQIGTFYQPYFVLVDPSFLRTLPRKEIISGFGEVIKYSYLTDVEFFDKLLSNFRSLKKLNSDFINEIIFHCVKIKVAIVSTDEYEKSGLRKILNFGHTFAHSYESISNYKISHGKAVIVGILNALHLSQELGLINQYKLDMMVQLPLKLKTDLAVNEFDEGHIFSLMRYDKKNKDGQNKFILIKDFGEIFVDVGVDRKTILKAIRKTKKILV